MSASDTAISCYSCCATCQDVRRAYGEKGWSLPDMTKVDQCIGDADDWSRALMAESNAMHGCRVYGRVAVAKVAGNFHIAPGESMKEYHSHVHDLHSVQPSVFNSSHRVDHFSFGEHHTSKPYPLDGVVTRSEQGGIMHQYYVQVVPTMYVAANVSARSVPLNTSCSSPRRSRTSSPSAASTNSFARGTATACPAFSSSTTSHRCSSSSRKRTCE